MELQKIALPPRQAFFSNSQSSVSFAVCFSSHPASLAFQPDSWRMRMMSSSTIIPVWDVDAFAADSIASPARYLLVRFGPFWSVLVRFAQCFFRGCYLSFRRHIQRIQRHPSRIRRSYCRYPPFPPPASVHVRFSCSTLALPVWRTRLNSLELLTWTWRYPATHARGEAHK